MMRTRRTVVSCLAALITASSPSAGAQGFSQPYRNQQNDMEQMLNFVQNAPGTWQTGAPPAVPQQAYAPARQSPMMPRVTRRDVARVFFEGGSLVNGGGGPSPMPRGNTTPAYNGNASSTAYSNYQRAANEATTARNYANKARYNQDKWIRKDSATREEYAANNANYAAQRAEAAAYSGDPSARGYANRARQEANRARESANLARYNADTIR